MEAILKRELSPTQRGIVTLVAVAIILVVAIHLLGEVGILGGPDSVAGYYALRVNPAPNATMEQMQATSIFGMQRLVLNANRTFRLATLHGNWSRSGNKVSLEPTTIPPADTFFTQTTMGSALSVLLKSCEFTVSTDEKKLTLEKASQGPVVFLKVNDVLR